MSEADYAALVTAAHTQLAAPVILIWDNLNTHISAATREWIGAHADWLTVERLPAYAPELNAAEGAWAHMKNSMGNLAVRDVSQLAAIVKHRLKSIQYRPTLIESFLAQTGLTLEPEPGAATVNVCPAPAEAEAAVGLPRNAVRAGAISGSCAATSTSRGTRLMADRLGEVTQKQSPGPSVGRGPSRTCTRAPGQHAHLGGLATQGRGGQP
jgi:transposase